MNVGAKVKIVKAATPDHEKLVGMVGKLLLYRDANVAAVKLPNVPGAPGFALEELELIEDGPGKNVPPKESA